MNRLHTTTAALIVLALATPGCSRNRSLPNRLAPSQVTTLAVNSYLWRAAVDTVSFAPLLQANAQNGVIITDWYANPKSPGERVKLTVAVLGLGGRRLRCWHVPILPTTADNSRACGRPRPIRPGRRAEPTAWSAL